VFALADVADALAAGLAAEAARLDREQAVYGLDARDEVALHPVLAEALRAAGYGVHREVRFPSERLKRSKAEGERCDLVITPDGRPLASPEAQGTLFIDPDAVDLEDALWLEVKAVQQFQPEGPNAGYSGQLLSTVQQDVRKLSKEPHILHAALLIVLFVAEPAVAEHDLRVWQDRCLERGLPIAAPYLRGLPITDRHGNAWCALALHGVAHL
jgi:hypothetical protein